jgi:uncharacterized surface protein with fasciclin (FAS1) repeats
MPKSTAVLTMVLLGSVSLTACTTMGADGMGADASASASAETTVGGAPMYASRTIVQNAVNSPVHTTLVAAVQAAGLADTLSGPGPFTVFAPTNTAFERLPAGTVETLLQPANRSTLQSVLTYHVVPGRLDASDLLQRIRAGGGSATLKTVQGATLTARTVGSGIVLVDAKGGSARVTQADVMQSNGIIHVTDAVSIPG